MSRWPRQPKPKASPRSDLELRRTSEPGTCGAYEVRLNGTRIGNVSSTNGRPAKTRWRASNIAGELSFAPTMREALAGLWPA